MIAVDTSSFIAFLEGAKGKDVDNTQFALEQSQAVLPPVVLSELLSEPHLPKSLSQIILELPLLEVHEGFWERSGKLRAKLIEKGYKARLADTLIAQSFIHNKIPPITPYFIF